MSQVPMLVTPPHESTLLSVLTEERGEYWGSLTTNYHFLNISKPRKKTDYTYKRKIEGKRKR